MIKQYGEALRFLEDLPFRDVKPGLDRIRHLLEHSEIPQSDDIKSVHIAGSNGKGSVLALLKAALKSTYKVGSFISPPLHGFRDRITVNDRPIPERALTRIISELEEPIAELKSSGNPPTLFEAATAVGAIYFAAQKVDLALWEVGLGGRFDATVAVGDPLLSIITNIEYEHADILGPGIQEIAREISGVVREARPLVHGPLENSKREIVQEECDKKNSQIITTEQTVQVQLRDLDWSRSTFKVSGESARNLADPKVKLPLLGGFQRENLAVALTALLALGDQGLALKPEEVQRGLEKASWPGRFQLVRRSPRVVLDGAHNLPAARTLKRELDRYKDVGQGFDAAVLVFSALKDKDYQGMMGTLAPSFQQIILTQLDHYRALPAKQLADAAEEVGIPYTITSQPGQAFEQALARVAAKDLICITGSLYLIREAVSNGFTE